MLWIVLALLALLIFYLLFVPLILVVDTDQRMFYFQMKGLAKASIETDQSELVRIRLDALFTHFYFYPLRSIIKRDKKTKEKKAIVKKRNRRKGPDDWLRYGKIGKKILHTFQVRKFMVSIDTGDCIQNAQLYPVAAFVDRYLFDFQVNYQDRNYVGLHLVNRPVHIIKAFINP
ncbi:hypothetical protein LVD13_04245 [Flavobacteriaceae bacterium D16]|nr:hypothetical protein [Flavobacteriaceae bacterium D16]